MTWEEIKAKRNEWSKKCPRLPELITVSGTKCWMNESGSLTVRDGSYQREAVVPETEIQVVVTFLASLFPDAARKGIGGCK